MNETFKHCQKQGFNKCELTVRADNDKAISLNRKFGFKKYGESKEYYSYLIVDKKIEGESIKNDPH